MRCPFLREAQVKFCCASEFKKMIVRSQSNNPQEGLTNGERCTSPAYSTCPSAKARIEDLPSQDHCPFLQESLNQYCSASSVVKYVPYSDPGLTRCGTSSHRYCELLMAMQSPRLLTPHDIVAPEIDADEKEESGYWLIDGIQTVGWLFYSANHMWADIDDDGIYHIGIDAFLARILGKVDRVIFATEGGEHNPSVSLTIDGVDFQMMFPRKMNITGINSRVRVEPNRVVSDPYTLGWLFEGKAPSGDLAGRTLDMRQGLVHGQVAQNWMKDESRRLTEFAHERAAARQSKGGRVMADGGVFADDIMNQLTREEKLLLYNEFFSLRPDSFGNF